MTENSRDSGEHGFFWQGTAEELERWKRYVQDKAVTFVRNGYSVAWYPDGYNWIDVFIPERWYAREPELRASVKFFNQPSKFGIEGGCISKLTIQLRHQDPIARVRGRPHEQVVTLFNYDRGAEIDRLGAHAEARSLYDLVLKFLN